MALTRSQGAPFESLKPELWWPMGAQSVRCEHTTVARLPRSRLRRVSNPEDAGRRFDELGETIMPYGGCGQTLTVGTARLTDVHWGTEPGIGAVLYPTVPDQGLRRGVAIGQDGLPLKVTVWCRSATFLGR